MNVRKLLLQPFIEDQEKDFVWQFGSPEENGRHVPLRSTEDLTQMHWRWCALCCASMILDGLKIEHPSLPEMFNANFSKEPFPANQAIYREIDGKFNGAFHRPLAVYLNSLGLNAVATRGINTMEGLTGNLLAENLIIASVGVNIYQWRQREPDANYGHMVLLYGANLIGPESQKRSEVIYMHNPAGLAENGSAIADNIPTPTLLGWMNGNAVLVMSKGNL